jgi:hypothetical protein
MKWSDMYWSQDGKNTLKLVFGMTIPFFEGEETVR